jgi:hypothetical protein
MKRIDLALPLAILAATATAQTNTVVGSDPALEGTTTITYSVCPTAATITTTLSSTLTLCPGPYCNGGSPSITLGPGQGGYETGYTTVGPNGESTVYETFYPATCSTGLVNVYYMITEACPCEATRTPDYLPSGFTTTVATVLTSACDACAATETTITLTTPCATGPYATAGVTNGGGAPAATGAGADGALAGGNSGAGFGCGPEFGNLHWCCTEDQRCWFHRHRSIRCCRRCCLVVVAVGGRCGKAFTGCVMTLSNRKVSNMVESKISSSIYYFSKQARHA